jgi:hypothetical protein
MYSITKEDVPASSQDTRDNSAWPFNFWQSTSGATISIQKSFAGVKRSAHWNLSRFSWLCEIPFFNHVTTDFYVFYLSEFFTFLSAQIYFFFSWVNCVRRLLPKC